jgi:hypothetical protein
MDKKEVQKIIDSLVPGTIFNITYLSTQVELVNIKTKEGTTKLKEPLYLWREVGTLKTFTNKADDIKKGIVFKNWIKNEDSNN